MSTIIKDIKHHEDVVVIVVEGELTFEQSPTFHKRLVEVAEGSAKHLVVDLSDLSYIDSSGVGTLVEIWRRLKTRQIAFSLVGLQSTVRSVFEITKLDGVFRIFETLEEARQQ